MVPESLAAQQIVCVCVCVCVCVRVYAWTIYRVFIELVTILFLFYVLFIFLPGSILDLTFLTRVPTCIAGCIGRERLHHRIARKVPTQQISLKT